MKSRNNPIKLFSLWFDKAANHPEIGDHTAMNLATVDRYGQPHSRMVLLKGYDHSGFTFYTNKNSHKGKHLRENPVAALCFYWEPMGRQIRIEGKVIEVPSEISDAYFRTRPRTSQIGAWASRQSEYMGRRSILLGRVAKYSMRFTGTEVPRPDFWGGYKLIPERIEFWKSAVFRLHYRWLYIRKDDAWTRHSLFP